MLNILKRNKSAEDPEKKGIFARIKTGLTKTRANFTTGIANLFLGKKTLDNELLEMIETQLLSADVGVDATQELIKHLTEKLARKELNDADAVMQTLMDDLKNI